MLTADQLSKLSLMVSKAMLRCPLPSDNNPNLTPAHYMEYVYLEDIGWQIRHLADHIRYND